MGNKKDTCLLQVMEYLKYIKDFDDLATENEKIYEFKRIYESDIDFVDYYYSDEMSLVEEYDSEDSAKSGQEVNS